MPAIKSAEISDIRLGTREVSALYIGDKQIWPSNRYLNVAPQYLFLTPWNQFTDDANVTSNVVWNVQ